MPSQVKGIINSLTTILEAITTANGYSQTVGSVLDASEHFVDLSGVDFPHISIFEGGEDTDEKLGGTTVDYSMGVSLRCYCQTDENEEGLESVRLIKDDVKEAIYDNPTLGHADVILAKVVNIAPPLTWGELTDPVLVDILLNIRFRRAF